MSEARGKISERWTYDVFLSFRGEDVRHGFLSHLYKHLNKYGINTFKDDESLPRGDEISKSLLTAIENSRVFLIVLSKNYASSRWCLDELFHIMECRKSNSRHIVLPIYYDVDPSDARKQRGSFGVPFTEHENRYPESKVRKWKEALTEVANVAGFVSKNYVNEAKLIKQVVKDVVKQLSALYLQLPEHVVDIKGRVCDLCKLINHRPSHAVQIILICGMGGIGKTTLAKAVCNEFSDRFDGISFLENFGQLSKKPEGKVQIQKQLLSDILGGNDIAISSMDHAVKQRFRNKKVLVVIDDAEDKMQLDSVAIDSNCFGPRSCIIITSRNSHLSEELELEVENIYSPHLLDENESLDLVSWHAFREPKPPEEFLQLSEDLVQYCGGLPLAVEVLGAFLFQRGISQWKSTLESLERIPHNNIQAKLQISFDALNAAQKDIFLDISCFFLGMDKDYVGCILDGCKLDPGIGLIVLKERCLITVHDNRLMMHDLLRDMGRHIVQGTFRNNYESWSRLWERDHVIHLLENFNGTNAIEGLSLKAEATAVAMLEVKAFSNLTKIRLLHLSHVELNGSYENFPKGLRWLCWFSFPEESFPMNLHLTRLVVMDLQKSNIKRLWKDHKKLQILKELKYLDLSHSMQLTETPDFSCLPNLEKLLLIDCQSLVMVHKSIGILQRRLILLNLSGCIMLSELPLELYQLKSLETLILSGCSQLKRFHDVGALESLITFKADYTALTEIPSSSNQLTKLKELSLDGCKDLWKVGNNIHSDEIIQAVVSLPLSLNGLISLKTLRLGFCNLSDTMVPENLESLPCLEELDLQGNNFCQLQTDFAGLLGLQILKLDNCSELQSMISLPKKLRSLYASDCIKLEQTPDLSECSVLRSLHLTNCSNLVETPGLDKLETVGVIHMEMCNRISEAYKEKIMKGWAVCTNGGIFIPGSSLPNWVMIANKTHSISFNVPESLNLDLLGFTLWTSYVSKQDDVVFAYSPNITFNNQTKGYVRSLNLAIDYILMYSKRHIWQGHFSTEDFLLETGDQVEVSVDFGAQVTILETGITLAYKEVTEISKEQLTQTEDEVDNELVTEAYREVTEITEEQLTQTGDNELVTEDRKIIPPNMDLQSEETVDVLNGEHEYMEMNEEGWNSFVGGMSNVNGALSGSSTARPRGRVFGVPKRCWCGEEITVKISKSKSNPYRIYIRCGFAATNKLINDNHTFKWADETLLNEIDILTVKNARLEQQLKEIKTKTLEFEKMVFAKAQIKMMILVVVGFMFIVGCIQLL